MHVTKGINILIYREIRVSCAIVVVIITEKCAEKSPRGVRGELLKYFSLRSLMSAM